MTENGAEGGERLHAVQWDLRREPGSEQTAEVDGSGAFENVEQKGERAKALAGGTQDVGGADVTAADGADVLLIENAHEQPAGGDRTEQVRSGCDDETCECHERLKFSRQSA